MALAALLFSAGSVRADDLSDLAAQVRRESELVERMSAVQGGNLAKYEVLAKAIQAAKRAGSLNPVAAATLQADLKLAHEQAVALQRANADLVVARQRLDAYTVQYRESLLARIEALQFELRQPSRAPKSGQELQRLTAELLQVSAPLPPMSASPVAAILDVGAPTPEQLTAASLELRDHAARLERQLSEVRSRIQAEEQQRRLQGRLRAMASSDALFEDGFGSRGRTARTAEPAASRAAGTGVSAESAAPELSGLASDSAGAAPPSGPVTGSPGGEGGRVAVSAPGRGRAGPVELQGTALPGPSGALVELRSREAAILRSIAEAQRARVRLEQASALLREEEQRAP
jgi:hypothetical protein